jgi:hypothetical protein
MNEYGPKDQDQTTGEPKQDVADRAMEAGRQVQDAAVDFSQFIRRGP